MKTTQHKTTICPTCSAVLDAATGAGEDVPSEGDLSICFYCNAILVFATDLSLHPITPDQFVELPEDTREEVFRYMAAILRRSTP
jgi:hypothetical protein